MGRRSVIPQIRAGEMTGQADSRVKEIYRAANRGCRELSDPINRVFDPLRALELGSPCQQENEKQ
jgi:hypothetical protein